MKKFSMVVCFILILSMFTALPINVSAVVADSEKVSASYTNDWQRWSQGASDYALMRDYGCWVVAMSKMFKETGIAPSGLTPDVFYLWERNNGWLPNNDYDLNQVNGAQAPVAYASAQGKNLELVAHNWSVNDSTLWSYINNGYYTIIQISDFQHYVYIDNAKSKSTGTIYIMESFTNQNYANSYALYSRYSGVTRALTYRTSSSPSSPVFTINEASDITETDAYISCSKITNPNNGTMTRVGFQMGTSSGNYTINKYDDLPSWTSSYMSSDYRMSDVNVTLTPGTNYYYRFYIVISGTTYYSDEKSFKTEGKDYDPIVLGDDFVAYITSSKSGMNIGANSDGNVELQIKSNSDNQKWHFLRQSDNSYKIINTGFNQCLDVANFGTANGTNIGLCPSNDTNAQRYYIRDSSSGYGIVPKVNSNAALDVTGGSLINGANIQEYEWNGSNAQIFSIDYVGLTPSSITQYNGHTYEYYDVQMPWNQAYRFCESKGGHLVTISDESENDLVHSLINSGVWLGCTSINNNGKWYWVTNEPFAYTNWNSGEPNCNSGIEFYGSMILPGDNAKKWNDLSLNSLRTVVCEYDNGDVNADNYTPAATETIDGITFSIFDHCVDWQTAEAICEAKGGRLVKIDSAAKNNAIVQLMSKGSKSEYWINETDRNSEGVWTDSEGNLLSYFNWLDGNPSNDFNAEQYGAILKDSGKWIDIKGFSPAYRNTGFICESDDSTIPQPSEDGWIYCDFLPSYVNPDEYTIEYDNYYEKQQKDSPGEGWVKAETIKNEWVNSGSQYTKTEELSTSDARVLVGTSYYHYCGPGAPEGYSNYEADSTYVHYDSVPNSMIGSRKYLGNDNGHWYYALYDQSGNTIWCQSGVTCDGQFGSHGNRSSAWYAIFTYQDRVKVELYKYTKDSGWTDSADSTAASTRIRYKKKNEVGDVNLDGILDIRDVTAIQRHLAKLEEFSNEQFILADTNGDDIINIIDATHLQKYLAQYDGIVLGKQPTA